MKHPILEYILNIFYYYYLNSNEVKTNNTIKNISKISLIKNKKFKILATNGLYFTSIKQ